MANADLIHLKGNDDPRSVEIRKKLKGTHSAKRKLSQQINAAIQLGDQARMLEILSNPLASAESCERILQRLLADYESMSDQNRLMLARLFLMKHETFFGKLVRTCSASQTTADVIIERLNKYHEQKLLEQKEVIVNDEKQD